MIAKTVACLAVVGSAAAYVPPMMSLSANRREVVAGAGAAAIAAPLLRSSAVNARSVDNKAPVITIFDGRGCTEHKNKEYTGPKAGDDNDECCVKVSMQKMITQEDVAKTVLREALSEMQR